VWYITTREELKSTYAYQAEASQGALQLIHEFRP
jgi:glycine cleavage system pyridoxal-binding protein P